MANSADPDQMLHSAASDLRLHCLLRPVCPNTRVITVLQIIKESTWVFFLFLYKNLTLTMPTINVADNILKNFLSFFREHQA